MEFIKILLYTFIVVFGISGVIVLATGALIESALHDQAQYVSDRFFSPAVLLIVVGIFIFLIALFGCYGSIRNNYCITMAFSVLLGFIFVLELAAGIAAFVLGNKEPNYLRHLLLVNMMDYNKTTDATNFWNEIQSNFGCCGMDTYTDWWNNGTIYYRTKNLPDSCCINETLGCGSPFHAGYVYKVGCVDAFETTVVKYTKIVGGVGIGIAAIQLLGVIFSCFLARSIKKHYSAV